MFKQILLFSVLCFLVFSETFANEQEFEFLPSSSVPSLNQPWMLPLDISADEVVRMRVKVFPHTLKQDGKHGVPDDKTTLTLKGKQSFDFTLDQKSYSANEVKINLSSSRIMVHFLGKKVMGQKLTLEASEKSPITLYRIKNIKKSHSYEGKIEVYADSNEIVAINELPIESYMRGVVPSESPSYWPLESLKAQAVAARSYAYYHYLSAPSSRNYHVDDTARFQVFGGLSGADSRTDIAVKETNGEILKYNDKVVVAFFHSYSGGTTDSAKNIFKTRSAPYCEGGNEIFSRDDLRRELNPKAHWIINWQTDAFSSKTIINKLKNNRTTAKQFSRFAYNSSIDILEESMNPKSATVQTLTIKQGKNAEIIDFTILRQVLGWSEFPAYHYRVLAQQSDDTFIFDGYGWGHHVGMSQWGAYMMAKYHNQTYRDILLHYYSNTLIAKI